MSFAREKRLLLGALALLAPLPLPFNDGLSWPLLIVYLAAVGVFLVRTRDGILTSAPNWMLNTLGALYLPILVMDLLVWGRGTLLGPVLHLGLFVVVVKLYGMRRERDKWQILLGIVFLFLVAIGTSVHPTVVLFMLGFGAMVALVLLRFAHWSVVAGLGKEREPTPLPAWRVAFAATLAATVLAVPLFALLPRVSTPFILGQGRGTGTLIQAAGFTDVVTLDVIGAIRESRQVVMRIDGDARLDANSVRLKAATYGFYDGRSWRREARGGGAVFRHPATGAFEIGSAPAVDTARAWLQPFGSAALPLPLETATVAVPSVQTLERDAGGGLRFWMPPSGTLQLELGLAAAPVRRIDPPTETLTGDDRYRIGLTPRMVELALEVAGSGSSRARAERLERYLLTELGYTTDFVGVSGDEAIDEFLFVHRRGHCEYFASALVMLLRAAGIPSRLVTGFLGAEISPLEGYLIVRQLNAHAWVEAWVAEEGIWLELDPTPPAGRPQAGGGLGWGALATQSWDYLLFRWERYVLTFGVQDQLELLSALRRRWRELLQALRGRDEPATAGSSVTTVAGASVDPGEASTVPTPWLGWLAVLLLLGSGAAIAYAARRRSRFGPAEAYLELRELLARGGLAVGPSTAPLELERIATGSLPAAALPVRRLVRDYVRVAFAGEQVATSPALLQECLDAVRRATTRSRRAARRRGR